MFQLENTFNIYCRVMWRWISDTESEMEVGMESQMEKGHPFRILALEGEVIGRRTLPRCWEPLLWLLIWNTIEFFVIVTKSNTSQ